MIHLNFQPFPLITTERTVLREMRHDDVAEYHIIRSDEEINKYIDNPRPKTHEETLEIIARMISYARNNKSVAWTIADKTTDKMIGSICLWTMNGNDDNWELGYGMLTQYQGKGLMKEALLAAIDYGFKIMNLEVVHAHTHKDNLSSVRLLENANFTRNLALEAAESHKEGMEHMVIYSLRRN